MATVTALLIAWLYVGRNLVARLLELERCMRVEAAGTSTAIIPTGGHDEISAMGFALARPANGVWAAVLLASFICTGVTFLGRAIVAAQRGEFQFVRVAFYFVGEEAKDLLGNRAGAGGPDGAEMIDYLHALRHRALAREF